VAHLTITHTGTALKTEDFEGMSVTNG